MMWNRFLLHPLLLLLATAFLACAADSRPEAPDPEPAACVLEEDHPDWQALERALDGPENKWWDLGTYAPPAWERVRGSYLVCYVWGDDELTCDRMPKGWLGTRGER